MKYAAALFFAPLCCVYASQVVLQSEHSGSYTTKQDELKPVLTAEFKAFVQEIVEKYDVPGMSLGVVHGGEVEVAAWGRRSEDNDPMTVDTLAYLGSCSKAFVSASIGILMDDFAHGRNNTPLPPGMTSFDWYTPVATVLPEEWGLMDEWASQRATLRDILSHQSGLSAHELSYASDATTRDVVLKMKYLRPAFQLRERWHYNNQMYMLGQYLVEKYAGMPYTEFVKQRIWEPLNMTSTTFYASEASGSGKLSQFWSGESGRRIPPWLRDEHVPLIAGAGGVLSSAVDMVKWLRLLLHSGVDPVTNATVIPKSAFEAATRAEIVLSKRATFPEFSISGYGMGWGRASYQGHEIVMHSGGAPGMSANVFFLPNDGLGLAALVNADSRGSQEHAAIYRAIEDYFSLEHIHSSRLLELLEGQTSNKSITKKPADLPPTVSGCLLLPLEKYSGRYVDPGYPDIVLCTSKSSSPECVSALSEFSYFENVTVSDTLYAILPSLWISHGRAEYVEEHTFKLTGTYLFPDGYGRDASPFEIPFIDGNITMDFAVEGYEGSGQRVVGLGLRGTVGEVTDRERRGGTVEEIADVYFRKI